MRILTKHLALSVVALVVSVPPLGAQSNMNAREQANLKFVLDWWREVIQSRHVELTPKYQAEDYIQHNINIQTGRAGFAKFFGGLGPPVPILPWCYLDPKKEPPLPIDDSDGGCDDPNPPPAVGNYLNQHPGIDIVGPDGISDSGVEIHSFCVQEGIKNIVLTGVHTNMCVLGRPFGIRQQKMLGNNVVLARDLTDAMYNPRKSPFVSHTRGTELVIEHIEKYWCPTIGSEDLTRVAAGSADPAK